MDELDELDELSELDELDEFQEAGQHIVALLPQDVVHLAMLAAYVGQQWSLRLEHLLTHLALKCVRRKLRL